MEPTKKKTKTEAPKAELTYEQIEAWILEHRKEMDVMDDLNRLTYPYTSKYADQVARGR